MKSNAIWFIIVLFLLTVIGVLSWIILGQPPTILPTATTSASTHSTNSEQAGSSQATTSPTPTPIPPLHEQVSIDEPASGASVGDTFTVSGKAPGNWYFEATFPIQVRDADDNVIGRGHANAQGDWMTTNLVAFTSTITIDGGYKGPATLILLRDNPSGLPENDDSVSVPIVIK